MCLFILTAGPFLVPLKAQWEPKLLEPPAHTHLNYVVTDLNGGPKPPAPVEDSYRKMTLTVSRCVLCWTWRAGKEWRLCVAGPLLVSGVALVLYMGWDKNSTIVLGFCLIFHLWKQVNSVFTVCPRVAHFLVSWPPWECSSSMTWEKHWGRSTWRRNASSALPLAKPRSSKCSSWSKNTLVLFLNVMLCFLTVCAPLTLYGPLNLPNVW